MVALDENRLSSGYHVRAHRITGYTSEPWRAQRDRRVGAKAAAPVALMADRYAKLTGQCVTLIERTCALWLLSRLSDGCGTTGIG